MNNQQLIESLNYFLEFVKKRDYDLELQNLHTLNLNPQEFQIAKEKILKAKEKAWRDANRERVKAYQRDYYHRKKNQGDN